MRRYQFLALSILAAAAFIAILTASEQRAGLLDDLQAENEYLQRRLDQSLEQLRTMIDRQIELEQQLSNVRQMEQICCNAPSRGGWQLTLATMPLTTPSGFTSERLERALADTGLAGLGQAFLAAEQEHGIDAVTLAAICYHESAGGTSRLARERNNLAGLGAYSAGMGMAFDTRADCIDYLARLLAGKPGTLADVGAWYAEDPGWSAKVAACVKSIIQKTEVSS